MKTFLLTFSLVFSFAVVALAQVNPSPDPAPVAPGIYVPTVPLPDPGKEIEWGVDLIKWFWGKIKSREYGPAVAFLIMALLAMANLILLRFTSSEIKKELMPHLAVAVAIGATLSSKLAMLQVGASTMEWLTAIILGFGYGLMAVGAYEYVGKKVYKWISDKIKAKQT